MSADPSFGWTQRGHRNWELGIEALRLVSCLLSFLWVLTLWNRRRAAAAKREQESWIPYLSVVKRRFEVKSERGECCSICLAPRAGLVAELPCGHSFHEACVMRWLTIKASCPMCRQLVRVNPVHLRDNPPDNPPG